jgi:hypothetical protein
MSRIIFDYLLFVFFLGVNINAQTSSINKVDSVVLEHNIQPENREFTSKVSVSSLFHNKLDSKVEFNPINAFVLKNSDSINTIFIYAKDTVNLVKNDSLFKYNNLLKPIDSISQLWNNDVFDSIKVILNNSFEKIFKFKSKIIKSIDTLSIDDISNKKEPHKVIEKVNGGKEAINNKEGWDKSWFFIIVGFGVILILVLKKYKQFKNKIVLLKKEIVALNEEKTVLHSKIKSLKSREKDYKDLGKVKNISVHNINNIDETRIKVIGKLQTKNTLDSSQLKKLTDGQENRWVTVAHSAIGKSHLQATPPIPCQDNNYFEPLNDNWQLAIVCDGAGSAKMSHFGSKLISNNAIPSNLKNALSNLKWFKNGELPSKKEWKNLGVTIFKETLDNLIFWVAEQNIQNNTNLSVNNYASTAMLTLYNSKGAVVANIGDGRGGYLSTSGELKSLFTPFGGDESNGTIFITSPIWENPKKFIQTDVIDEKLLAIFLLSDGMEKVTFECSNLTDNVFTDANIPFKKFFFPVLSKIKSLNSKGEEKLKDEWKSLLESGNEAIKNEPDDKTLLVSFLK